MAPEPAIESHTFLNIKPEEFVVLKQVLTNVFPKIMAKKRDFNNFWFIFLQYRVWFACFDLFERGWLLAIPNAAQNHFLQLELFFYKVLKVRPSWYSTFL